MKIHNGPKTIAITIPELLNILKSYLVEREIIDGYHELTDARLDGAEILSTYEDLHLVYEEKQQI